MFARSLNGSGTSRISRRGVWSLDGAQAGAPGLRTAWQGAPCAGGTCAEPAHDISAPWAKQNMREKTTLWEMPWFHWAPPLGEFRGTKHPPAPGKAAMPPCCCCFCPCPCHTETMPCPWLTSGLWLFSLSLYLLPAARAAQLLSPRCRALCRAKEQAQRFHFPRGVHGQDVHTGSEAWALEVCYTSRDRSCMML